MMSTELERSYWTATLLMKGRTDWEQHSPPAIMPKAYWDGNSIQLSLTRDEARKFGLLFRPEAIYLTTKSIGGRWELLRFLLPSEAKQANYSVVASIRQSETPVASLDALSHKILELVIEEGFFNGALPSLSKTGEPTPSGPPLAMPESSESVDPFFYGTKGPLVP